MRPVVAVIGPSGSGKSTVVRELHGRGLVTVHPTWTTRPRRADERRGSLEHRFVTDAIFDELDANGFFIDTVTMFGLPYRYGLPARRESAGDRFDLVMVRAPLIEHLRRHLAVGCVYQIEDAPRRVHRRILERGGPADDISARLVDNEREQALGRTVADRTFVNRRSIGALADEITAALELDAGVLTSLDRDGAAS